MITHLTEIFKDAIAKNKLATEFLTLHHNDVPDLTNTSLSDSGHETDRAINSIFSDHKNWKNNIELAAKNFPPALCNGTNH